MLRKSLLCVVLVCGLGGVVWAANEIREASHTYKVDMTVTYVRDENGKMSKWETVYANGATLQVVDFADPDKMWTKVTMNHGRLVQIVVFNPRGEMVHNESMTMNEYRRLAERDSK